MSNHDERSARPDDVSLNLSNPLLQIVERIGIQIKSQASFADFRDACQRVRLLVLGGHELLSPVVQTLVSRAHEFARANGIAPPLVEFVESEAAVLPALAALSEWATASDSKGPRLAQVASTAAAVDLETPIVEWMGGETFRVDDGKPVAVSTNERNVLQSFVGMPAMSGPTLASRSGVEYADRVLRTLRGKYGGMFRDAIALPGGKNKGGYRVTVVEALE